MAPLRSGALSTSPGDKRHAAAFPRDFKPAASHHSQKWNSPGSNARPQSASRMRGKSVERLSNLSLDESTTSRTSRCTSASRCASRNSRVDQSHLTARPPLSMGSSRPASQPHCPRHESRSRVTSPHPTSYWRDLSAARGTATPHWKSVVPTQPPSKCDRSPPTSLPSRNHSGMYQGSPPHVANRCCWFATSDVQACGRDSGITSPAPSAKWSPAIPVDFTSPYKMNKSGHYEAEADNFSTPVAKDAWYWPSPCRNLIRSEERHCASDGVSGTKHFSIGDQPAKHFSIGDQPDDNAQVVSDDRSRQLSEVARSLETAAAALRNVVSPGFNVEGTASLLSGLSKSRLLQSPWRDSRCVDDVSKVTLAKGSCTPSVAAYPNMCQCRPSDEASSCKHDDEPLARLARENEALRGALGDAVRKLTELEGEKERFLSEDVFDLVNSLCRDSTGGAPESPEREQRSEK